MDRYTQITTAISSMSVAAFNVSLAAISALLAYLNISQEAMAIMMGLMAIDLFTGSLAAFVRKEILTIPVFLSGLAIKAILLFIPVVTALADKGAGGGLLWFSKFTIIAIIATEVLSIFNKFLKASGEPMLPNINAISMLAKLLRGFLLHEFERFGNMYFKNEKDDDAKD